MDGDEEHVPEHQTSYQSRTLSRRYESTLRSDGPKNLMELSKREPYVYNPSHTQLNENGDIEETWEFDPDAYALGVCSLLQKGWERAWPDVVVAILSPLLQNIAFFGLFSYLIKLEEPTIRPQLLGIIGICLFLMSVNLVQEMNEAVKKMVFCLRCLLGKYELTHNPNIMIIGAFLAFFQNLVAVGTFALTSDLLLRSKSVLDVFLNFLGISFITEVDNTLMRVGGVQLRAKGLDFVFSIQRARQNNSVPDAPSSPITVRMLMFLNTMTLFPCLMSMWIGLFGDERGRQYWQEYWLLFWSVWFLVMVLCNFVLWIGSRMIGPWKTLISLHVVFQLLWWISAFYRYYHDGGWMLLWNPLLNMVAFVIPQVWMPIGIACEVDALMYLDSSWRMPLVSATLLLSCPFWVYDLVVYGSS